MTDPNSVCRDIYQVVRGDTLFQIASRYGVSVPALIRANQIQFPALLRVGQKLCIPGRVAATQQETKPTPPCPGGTLITVEAQQLMDILREHRMTFADMVCSNPGMDLTQPLAKGAQICVPKESKYHSIYNVDRSYITISGDNLDTIARRLGVTSRDLLIENPILRVEDFRVRGIRICIPQSAMQTSAVPPWKQQETAPAPVQQPTTEPDLIPPPEPLPELPVEKPCDQILYTIEFETLTRILENFRITYGTLRCYNPDIDFTKPMPKGTQLCIPRKDIFRACLAEDFYIIRAGDNIDVISRRLAIPAIQLMISNPGYFASDFSQAGVRLCIPLVRPVLPASSDQVIESEIRPMQEDCPGGKLMTIDKETLLDVMLANPDLSMTAIACSNFHVDFLKPLPQGAKICIPDQDWMRRCPGREYYIVRTNDSVDTIARRLGVTSEEILVANPSLRISDYGIRGLQVCLPSTVLEGQQVTSRTGPSKCQEELNPDVLQYCQDQKPFIIKNERLADIMEHYDLEAGTFMCLNSHIDLSKPLKPGAQLCIPSGERFQSCFFEDFYSVRDGDDFDIITRKLGVDPLQMILKNPTRSINDYKVLRTRICIPDHSEGS